MQHTLEREFMRDKLTFVIIVTGAIRDIPVDGRLERRRDSRRMRDVVLKQILSHAGTAERIAIIQAQRPLEHFILFKLRRKASIKRTAPMEILRKLIAPVCKFRKPYLVRIRVILMVETMTRIDRKHVIRQNLETERR